MTQIATVLARFGNVREAAEKIGRPPSVIQYWRTTNRIPATAMASVLAAAERHGVEISAAELIPSPQPTATEAETIQSGTAVPHGPFVQTSSGMRLSSAAPSDCSPASSAGLTDAEQGEAA